KILLGIDDSPHSRAALEYVKRASWPKDVEVIALSAASPIFVGPGEAAAPMVVEQINTGQRAYHQSLAEAAARELRAAGLKADARSPVADPRHALLEAADGEGIDLIVLGSHGRTGLSKLLIGSVASHVVTHARCSVLVVKKP
ncbi:MAG TPA: universal stress protein, partial [Candidatus Eisenbacteria bacterium]